MRLGELDALHPRRKRKRVGRGVGSGHGKTCGRGTKGQKARSKVRLGFEGGQMPLFRRIPKRGFRGLNKRFTPVNIEDLNRFSEGEEVSIGLLRESGLIKRHEIPKILARGKLTVPLTIKIPYMSNAARKMIIESGGKIL